MKLIGYWAVGKNNNGRYDRKPGDLFVSLELYGAVDYYTNQGYTLIPSFVD